MEEGSRSGWGSSAGPCPVAGLRPQEGDARFPLGPVEPAGVKLGLDELPQAPLLGCSAPLCGCSRAGSWAGAMLNSGRLRSASEHRDLL